MFTDADHAKAVELYKRFGTAEWWPALMHDRSQGWTDWGDRISDFVALSVIAWAMVERLGDTEQWADMSTGLWLMAFDDAKQRGSTRFLALAAAIENTNKEA